MKILIMHYHQKKNMNIMNHIIIFLSIVFIFACSPPTTDKTKETQEIDSSIREMELGVKLMDIWESGDTALLSEIFHSNGTYVDMPNNHTFEGIPGAQAYVNHVHTWGTNINMEIKDSFFANGKGHIQWTFTAVQTNPIPGRVPVATDQKVTLNGVTLFEFKEDKIFKATDYLDAFGFVLQLGSKVELPGGVVIGGQ